MDLLNTAANMFISKMGASGNGLDASKVTSGLAAILPMRGGKLDLAALLSLVSQNEGLAKLATSWLGDDRNDDISANDVMSLLGEGKVKGFSQYIGLEKNAAASGLARMLPDLIDSNSQGGALMDMAKKSFGKKLLKGLFSRA